MKLKRLQLQGYKTFASRTEFDFESGITAIVGPNGSGKSNIADAVRWVLGEQSYSTLRGKRTTDMIFAGSQERARAGMAQAILTLDNSDGWLPIDYAEVEIGRRAYRSGENEYLINGQRVRLRDVQELLATSGLAERTYTIIGQGLVDQALSLRAEERRALFEEAAGVSHYQARRATTLRRLQETEHNLERVHDILSEIRPRLGGLKRQANRALTYQQVEADLRHLLRIWYGYQWEVKKETVREQRKVAQKAEQEWKEARRELASKQEEIGRLRRQIGEIQRQLNEARQERERLREERERTQRQVAILGERQTLLQRQLAEIDEEMPRLREQEAAARENLDGAVAQLEAAQGDLAAEQEQLLRFNKSFEEQEEAINRQTEKAERLERERREAQKRLAQAEGQLSQLQERLQEHKQAGNDGDSIAEAEKRVAAREEAVAKAEERLQALREEQQALQEKQKEARQSLREKRREQEALNRRANQLNKEVASLETRCELLDQMRHKEIDIQEGVSLVGRVAGMVQIPEDFQHAVEAALGMRLAALVLSDENSLWRLIDDNGHQETATAIVLEGIHSPPKRPAPEHPDVIGWAADVVQAQGTAEAVADLLFRTILLVKTRAAAYAVGRPLPSGYLTVTPDGFVVHGGGLVEVAPRAPQNSILAREEAWRTARQNLAEKQTAADEAQEEAAAHQDAIDEAQATYEKVAGEMQRLEQRVNEAAERLRAAQRELDRSQQHQEFLVRQREAAVKEGERLAARIEEARQAITTHQEEAEELEVAVVEARRQLEGMPIAEARQQRETLQQAKRTAQTIVAGREAVVESRRATLNQIEAQIRRQQERRRELQQQQEELNLDEARDALRQIREKIQEVDGQIQPLSERLSETQAAQEKLEDEVEKVQRRTHDLETHYTQMKVALSQRENEIEGLKERIQADLGLVALAFDEEQGGQTPLPMAEVVEQLPEVEELPEDIEETIQNYRAQLNRIGAVNPDAPAEYEQTQERYEFLTQQVEDLLQTKKRLRGIIAELDELTSKAFAKTVEEVDKIFGDMFRRLFGGGSAQLVLTEPDDLTISGVDIIARLPNRRQQRLALLSGGERSLTAAALIFALLKVAPPPFCVLDEVDAMLDEANVNRFRAVLRDLAQNSQFIVITHNRGTVRAAETVYGVSMGTDSTSQVISIKPEEYVNGE